MFGIRTNNDWFPQLPLYGALVACGIFVLGTGGVASQAQQIKEIPSDHGIEAKQPAVYWHDANSKFDLDSSTGQWAVVLQQDSAPPKRVPLPDILEQVDSIRPAGSDRIVVLADLAAGAHYVGLIRTDPAKLFDEFWTSAPPGLSPDNRWVLFVRFYPMHGAEGYDDQYRLYDVLGSRAVNWPGRPVQDAPTGEIISYDTTKAGMPVYPLSPAEAGRDNTNVPENEAHQALSSFIWDSDSKRVMFADEVGGRISLVIVNVPTDQNQQATTLSYELSGDQSPCAGVCLPKNIGKLEWNGDAVKAQLLSTPTHAPDREINLNLLVSQFIPVRN